MEHTGNVAFSHGSPKNYKSVDQDRDPWEVEPGVFTFKHFSHCNLVEILAGIFKLECSPLAVVYSNSDS